MSQIISDIDRIKWIRYLQCNLGTLADTTSKAFAYRKKNRECLRDDLILLNNVIRILYDYVTFDDVVTYGYSFTFTKTSASSDTITLTIGAQTFVLVTSGDGEDIASSYFTTLDTGVQSPELYAELDGNTLYVFSYSNSLNFASTSTVTSSNSLTTTTITSLEDSLQDILNLWNCLTNDQICSLISIAYELEDGCNC